MKPADRLTSDASYRLLVESIVDVAIFMLDPDGTIVSWNSGAQRLKGYAASEIIGRHFSVFYSAADRTAEKPAKALESARTEGKFEGEGWRVRKDGSRFWAAVVIDAIHDEAGALVGFAKVTRDVTERSVKEEQHRLIVEAAPNGMLIINAAGFVSLANAQSQRIFGYRNESMAGLSAQNLLGSDMFERIELGGERFERDDCLGRSHFHAERELTGRRRDGTAVPLEVTFNVTPTAAGPVIVASITDITERRAADEARTRAAAELLTANRLLSMAEEMAHYGHWRYDLRANDMYVSDEVYRTYGVPNSRRLTLQEALAAYDTAGPDVTAIVADVMRDGAPFTFESRLRRPDGSYRDVRCGGRGERDDDGTLVAIVGIFQDITDRKDAERERDRLVERMTLATQAGKVGIWEWDIAGGSMAWDAPMFALYGLDPDAGGASFALWRDALAAEDRERALRDTQDALDGNRPFDTEFRVVWPNGERHHIRALATVVRDTAQRPVRMIGINWDITEVRTLASALEVEKERQRAYERERLYEHERKWSTTFQRAVLPLVLPKVAGCAFDAVYEPGLGDAHVGGDWYDAVQLIDGRVLIAIGDVAGSGLEAAVVVGVVRQIMRGISQLHASPMLILDAADRALCLEYPDIYVSAWVGVIDLVTCTLTYASAGHPPPLMVSRDGSVRELGDTTTLLIGLREGHRGQSITVAIDPGDTVVLYTDGVTEAGRDIMAGSLALSDAAATLAAHAGRFPAEAIKEAVIPDGALDDVAILVVRTDTDAAGRLIERYAFDPFDRDAAGTVRASLVDSLRLRGCTSEECANAELVFGELIGNVVRHARSSRAADVDVDVAIDHGGKHSVLHVLDRGPGFSHVSRLPSDPYAENGRGLFLIAALTIDFTVTERADGGSHARAVLRGGSPTLPRDFESALRRRPSGAASRR